MKQKTKKKWIKWMILLAVAIYIITDLAASKYGLVTTHYEITLSQPSETVFADITEASGETSSADTVGSSDEAVAADTSSTTLRIAQITDLHDSVFGEDNERLVEAVREENPDLIFITGDLVNSKSGEDTTIAVSLIRKLAEIAPVYFSYGNQEEDLVTNFGVDITSLYTEAGATVLDKSYVDVEVNGCALRIGGIYGYVLPRAFAMDSDREGESAFMEEFQDTDRTKLLLCHMPYSWLESGSLCDWDVDCVFAGHVHGGQIRIPFVGGLYAPDQGMFPGKECGVYTTTEKGWNSYLSAMESYCKGDTTKYTTTCTESYLVLSRGLGNTDRIPRFNNIPELTVTDLTITVSAE